MTPTSLGQCRGHLRRLRAAQGEARDRPSPPKKRPNALEAARNDSDQSRAVSRSSTAPAGSLGRSPR
eukprot:10530701-Alexandrium_andersonii.AAC.1